MSQMTRVAPGRYPRGEETKQRIICSAIDTFGSQGYAGTSTRDIAAAANVNTPAIQYYFDGKLGLYHACIEQLSDKVRCRIAPAVDACQAGLAGGADLIESIALLGEVQNCLIDSFFLDHEGSAIRKLLAWEDAEAGEAKSEHFMRERIGLPIFETYKKVVERVTAARLSKLEIEMHALSLMGVSMIFHFNQCRALNMLNWTLDDAFIATLKKIAHKQLSYALIALSQQSEISVLA